MEQANSPSKPWYKVWWKILGFVFVVLPFLPFFLTYWIFRHPNWSKKLKLGLIVGTWIVAFTLPGLLGSPSKVETKTPISQNAPVPVKVTPKQDAPNPVVTPIPNNVTENKNYEIVSKNETKTIENYKVLISPTMEGKTIALEVKRQCKKPCNIDIFDDRQALKLQDEYDVMAGTLSTTPKEAETWKQKNYVFLADHLVGYINFELDKYTEYPYKDWYYLELKK